MQAYSTLFARVYNRRWIRFAQKVAPLLETFYATTPIGQTNKAVLDLCCGTGQLAAYFLYKGYRVTGLDLSAAMLYYAKENNTTAVSSGQAQFIQGDASNFQLDERFGLVLSTFDALNHLADEEALRRCFACALAVCDGFFVFDLNTRVGMRRWSNLEVDDSSEEMLIVNHGIVDIVGDKAWLRVTGFVRNNEGLYERFDETVFNTIFEMDRVKRALLEVGWPTVYFAQISDLKTPLADPELVGRVFIVASKY